MAKQIEKKIVPPREERLEQIGDPKTPKMGGITPTKVELPEVDDLLEKLKKIGVGSQTRKELLRIPLSGTVDFGELWSKEDSSHCHVNCQCPPCRSGYCSHCSVEALRDHHDRAMVRAAVTEFRGTIFQ